MQASQGALEPVYLDHAATTPPAPEVRAAMEPWLDSEHGNPSSRHPLGQRAADALESARESVAASVGAQPQGVVFTSGGTEANNLAVLGLARARARLGRHVLIGATEHPSVRAPAEALTAEGFEVEWLRLDSEGRLDLDHAGALLREDTVLVSQMLVNNEVGAVQPVAELAPRLEAAAPRAWLHVDAVQAFGKLDVRMVGLGAHALSLSAHKLHGPKGAGALVLARGVKPRPLVYGGGQEGDLRSGTEAVAACVGFGRAVELAVEARADFQVRAGALRARLLGDASALGLQPVLPAQLEAIPNILALVVPGPPAEVWLHHLAARGVYVGTGSACQSKKGALSPALLAHGLSEDEVRRVLRFSFARTTTDAEVERASSALRSVAQELEGVRS